LDEFDLKDDETCFSYCSSLAYLFTTLLHKLRKEILLYGVCNH